MIKNKREADNISRTESSKKKAVSAKASQGQLVFIKAEGDKKNRRDLYMVLESNVADDTVIICKVRDALSNRLASMVPHDERFRYVVKQTDIILAPNQPTIRQHRAIEVEESYESGEEEEPTITHSLTKFNEEEEDEDLQELWFPGINPHPVNLEANEMQEQTANSEDQTEREEQQLNQVNNHQGSSPTKEDEEYADEPCLVQELLAGNEVDIINTGEEGDEEDSEDEESSEGDGAGGGQQQVLNSDDDESSEVDEAGGAHQQILIVDQIDQSRKPVRGDLIAFVKDTFWVRAKIKSRAQDNPNYYNVKLEDGSQIGVFLNPPDGDYRESWTFLHDKKLWNPPPPEQLRETHQRTSSRCATPITTPTQERIHEHAHVPISRHELLFLDPNQQLETGRVHLIPQDLEITVEMDQEMTGARRKEKSLSTKVKKAFNWGKK